MLCRRSLSAFASRCRPSEAPSDRRGATFRGVRNTGCTFNVRLQKRQVEVSLGHGLWRAEFVTGVATRRRPGAAMLLNISPRLGFNRSVPPAPRCSRPPRSAGMTGLPLRRLCWRLYQAQYYYAWWVMRSGLISPRFYMTREGMTPSKIHYVGVWQWDAFFHALAYRHVDMKLAEDQTRLVLDHQRADGMIPDAVHDEGIVTHMPYPVDADVTKPPLIAWTALKLYRVQRPP